MKNPTKRTTLSKGSSNGYAVYDSVLDSLQDLGLYFDYYQIKLHNIPDAKTYVSRLSDNGYFTDAYSNYLNGVNNALNYYP